MKKNLMLMFAALCGLISNASGQVLMQLNPAGLTGNPGVNLTYNATLTNTGNTTVFLNGIGFNNLPGTIVPSDALFFSNWPLSISAGDSVTANLFQVSIDPSALYGNHIGTVSVFGGANGGSTDLLASSDFLVKVANILFFQDFEDATPGQTLGEAPLSWTPRAGTATFGVQANLHPGWSGNAVSHLTASPGLSPSYTSNVATPASGIVQLSFKCWAFTPQSGEATVGVGTLPYGPNRVECRFGENSYILVSSAATSYFGSGFANATAYVYGYIDLTNLTAWMVVTNDQGQMARSSVLPVPSGVRNVPYLWLIQDRRFGGQGSDLDNIKYQVLPPPTLKTISGTVDLSDLAVPPTGVQVEVEISDFASQTPETQTVTLGADGSYSLMTMRQGDANVSFKASHWLRRTIANVEIPNTGYFGMDASLINGDCDGDNEVGIGDYAVLSAAYNSAPGDGNWNPDADLNGDESADIADYAILSRNYGMVGDD